LPSPAPASPAPARPAPISASRVKAEIKTAPVSARPVPAVSTPTVSSTPIPKPDVQKEKIMDMTSNYTSGIQGVIAEAQDKAKEVFEKSSTALSEMGEFTRGNVEAIVESSKILASGIQTMGSSMASEGRSAFETMTADFKELAAAKTPADFLKIQSELVRRSFDGAVAYGSKNSEAVLKLATDAFAPISGRVSLAVEKARTTV
jgi:phasin family protein